MIVFFRDDDVDEVNPQLTNLVKMFAEEKVPINLEVVPGRVGISTTPINNLKNFFNKYKDFIEVHQHGFNHFEYAPRNEFPDERINLVVSEEIKAGKIFLETYFKEFFYPAFTPPWHRIGKFHIPVIEKLGFKIISAGFNLNHKLKDLSVYTDLSIFDNKLKKSRFATKEELIEKFEKLKKEKSSEMIGFYLHHKFYKTPESIEPIREFIKYLKEKEVKIKTFSQIWELHK